MTTLSAIVILTVRQEKWFWSMNPSRTQRCEQAIQISKIAVGSWSLVIRAIDRLR